MGTVSILELITVLNSKAGHEDQSYHSHMTKDLESVNSKENLSTIGGK